jgi:hypothetical protein
MIEAGAMVLMTLPLCELSQGCAEDLAEAILYAAANPVDALQRSASSHLSTEEIRPTFGGVLP